MSRLASLLVQPCLVLDHKRRARGLTLGAPRLDAQMSGDRRQQGMGGCGHGASEARGLRCAQLESRSLPSAKRAQVSSSPEAPASAEGAHLQPSSGRWLQGGLLAVASAPGRLAAHAGRPVRVGVVDSTHPKRGAAWVLELGNSQNCCNRSADHLRDRRPRPRRRRAATAALEKSAAIRARMDTAADAFADGAIDGEQLVQITSKSRPDLKQHQQVARAASTAPNLLDLATPDIAGRWQSML